MSVLWNYCKRVTSEKTERSWNGPEGNAIRNLWNRQENYLLWDSCDWANVRVRILVVESWKVGVKILRILIYFLKNKVRLLFSSLGIVTVRLNCAEVERDNRKKNILRWSRQNGSLAINIVIFVKEGVYSLLWHLVIFILMLKIAGMIEEDKTLIWRTVLQIYKVVCAVV